MYAWLSLVYAGIRWRWSKRRILKTCCNGLNLGTLNWAWTLAQAFNSYSSGKWTVSENGPNGSCVSWTILIPWCARDNRETVYRWLGIIEKKEFLFADRELELALFRFKIYSMEDGEIWAKESKNEGTFLSNIATLPIVFLGGPPNTADRLNIFSWKPFFVVENQQCRGCSSASYVLWSYNELQWWIYTFRVVIIFCILLCKI